MADTTVVVEGKIKFRDGKKWKPRWCVMKKPSPVADRLQVLLYKDFKDTRRDGAKPKTLFPLEGFYGLESFPFDKEPYVMAVLCHKQVTLLAFESREYMIQFEIKIRRSLGQEHQFPVQMAKVPHNSRLPLELVRMHIHGQKFCLTAYIPPKILQSWQICDLRRFGSVEGKFCFEGGSKCGRGMGIHVALSEQAEDIASIVQLASQGKLTNSNSNCNSNKRSSQIPGAFDSVGSSFPSGHHGLPPSMLGCCGDPRNQDDWGWQKRHSISVMDYRRMAAFAEKSKLMSIENLERQRLLAIYDVPPKRIRKVEPESNSKPDTSQKTEKHRLCSACLNQKSSSCDVPQSCVHVAPSPSPSHSLSPVPSVTPTETCGQSCLTRATAQSARDLLKLHARGDYHGYSRSLGSQGNYQLSVIEDEIRMANDRSKRKEALQKLQREESSLQREITLLDEILQVCKFDEDPKEPRGGKGLKSTEKSSSLPSKSRKDLRIDTALCNKEGCRVTYVQKAIQKDDIESSCLSPNLLNKLKEIPSHSKLLAPLPYINLSKYDDEGDKSNHVHVSGSGDKLVTASACSSSLSNVSVFNKENSPHTQNMKQKLGGRSSSESRIAAKSAGWEKEREPVQVLPPKREPIYANDCQQKEDTPPPELPPKGPALLRKNMSRTGESISPTTASLSPPALPARDRSRSLGSQGKLHGYDNAPGYSYNKTSSVCTQESYLLMGGFQEEPKESLESASCDSDESFQNNLACRPQLLGAAKGRCYDSSQYMEMAGQFEPNCPKRRISDSSSSESDLYGFSPSPRPSIELRITEPIDEKEAYLRPAAQESNYMEMSGLHSNRNSQVIQNLQTLQNYVSSTPGGVSSQASRSDAAKTAMPFPNLLNFQKRQTEMKRSSPKASSPSSSSNTCNEQLSEAPKEGFLARFMRRSSRDQKAASQSQENLTGPRSRASFLERSQSDQGEEQVAPAESTGHMKVGRQRSSSFPNRLSYQEATTDTKNKDSPPPLPPERNKTREYRGSKSLSLDDSPSAHVEVLKKGNVSPTLKRNVTEPLLKAEDGKTEMRVLTVLHVQQELTNPYIHLGDSSKTDDEKLIELLQSSCGRSKLDYSEEGNYASLSDLKSKMTLPLSPKKLQTPSEQAAEIARHVTSLPPFIPPKTKPYPSTLSPVIEAKLSPNGMESESIYVEMKELPIRPTDPAAQKHLARATLRISPPVEDENGKIWVPRNSLRGTENAEDTSADDAKCESSLQYSALVVSLDDLNDKLDAISVSSHESSDANSTRSEETVRSSPASTILRPRSGRDYQVVERKRTASESCTSSPKTPYSPSNTTVFTFEASTSSVLSEEPNSYMNVDMTPGAKHSVSRSVSDHEQTINDALRDKRSAERETVYCERVCELHESGVAQTDSPGLVLKEEKAVYSLEGDSVTPEHEKNPFRQEFCAQCSSEGARICDKDQCIARAPVCYQANPCACSPGIQNVPTSPSSEQMEPQLNYAEIDLSTACSSPTPSDTKRRPKKTHPSKPIAYATIDMVATNAVKKAGIEHAQARDSLRRSVSVHAHKTSTPVPRDRKFSMRERKMSTGSLGDT